MTQLQLVTIFQEHFVLVGTTTIVRNKTADSPSNLSQNNPIQVVDIKGYLMKEISRT